MARAARVWAGERCLGIKTSCPISWAAVIAGRMPRELLRLLELGAVSRCDMKSLAEIQPGLMKEPDLAIRS